jgi:hypothetical protein
MAPFIRSETTERFVARRDLHLLVTGCGRSGTKYTAFLLQQLGIDAPHERLGRDGICSWTMAVYSETRRYGPPSSRVSFREVFHQVRDPLAVISSAVTLRAESWDFIRRHIDCPDAAIPIVRAAHYWVLWNEQAERVATWRYRVEDLDNSFGEFCARIGVKPDAALIAAIPRDFNTRHSGRALHLAEELCRRLGLNTPRRLRTVLSRPRRLAPVSWEMLRALDSALCARVQAKAAFYGYAVS